MRHDNKCLTRELALPEKNGDNRRVLAYLRSRGIDREIINYCIDKGYYMRVCHIIMQYLLDMMRQVFLNMLHTEQRFLRELWGNVLAAIKYIHSESQKEIMIQYIYLKVLLIYCHFPR